MQKCSVNLQQVRINKKNREKLINNRNFNCAIIMLSKKETDRGSRERSFFHTRQGGQKMFRPGGYFCLWKGGAMEQLILWAGG